jgi:hypothetical protein
VLAKILETLQRLEILSWLSDRAQTPLLHMPLEIQSPDGVKNTFISFFPHVPPVIYRRTPVASRMFPELAVAPFDVIQLAGP